MWSLTRRAGPPRRDPSRADSMDDRLVVLEQFNQRHEAEAVKSFLEEAGIASLVDSDDAGGAYAGMSFSHPVRLLVRSSDQERAASLLEESPLPPS